MDLQAPDELIRRIQAELDAEYAAERAAAQPARRSRRRWPMLAAAAALVLLGAIAGQMLTIRTTSSDLAITVPNAADPGSAAVEETSDGDGFVFGIQPAGAAPLDELALALLEAEEPVTAFRDAGQVVAGELGPGPYVVALVSTVNVNPAPGEAEVTELETATSVIDGSGRVRVFTDGELLVESIVDDSSLLTTWAQWPADAGVLLDQLRAKHETAADPDEAAAFELLDAIRSPLLSNRIRATAWLALGQSSAATIEVLEPSEAVVVSIPVEGGVLIADAYADLRTGRIDRVEERWGADHPDAGTIRSTTWYPPATLTEALED